MVWTAVTNNGKFPLNVIDKRIKINTQYYILDIYWLLHADRLYRKKNRMFQQCSEPSQRSELTQA